MPRRIAEYDNPWEGSRGWICQHIGAQPQLAPMHWIPEAGCLHGSVTAWECLRNCNASHTCVRSKLWLICRLILPCSRYSIQKHLHSSVWWQCDLQCTRRTEIVETLIREVLTSSLCADLAARRQWSNSVYVKMYFRKTTSSRVTSKNCFWHLKYFNFTHIPNYRNCIMAEQLTEEQIAGDWSFFQSPQTPWVCWTYLNLTFYALAVVVVVW
jgi:hypothetical protein